MHYLKKEPEAFMVFLRNNAPNLKETGLSAGEIQIIWLVASRTNDKAGAADAESIPPHNLYKYVF